MTCGSVGDLDKLRPQYMTVKQGDTLLEEPYANMIGSQGKAIL